MDWIKDQLLLYWWRTVNGLSNPTLVLHADCWIPIYSVSGVCYNTVSKLVFLLSSNFFGNKKLSNDILFTFLCCIANVINIYYFPKVHHDLHVRVNHGIMAIIASKTCPVAFFLEQMVLISPKSSPCAVYGTCN